MIPRYLGAMEKYIDSAWCKPERDGTIKFDVDTYAIDTAVFEFAWKVIDTAVFGCDGKVIDSAYDHAKLQVSVSFLALVFLGFAHFN